MSNLGDLPLLISLGLKLRLRCLTRPEVWAGAGLAEAAYENLKVK